MPDMVSKAGDAASTRAEDSEVGHVRPRRHFDDERHQNERGERRLKKRRITCRKPQEQIHVTTISSRDPAPGVLAQGRRTARWILDLMMVAWQVHHFDAV